MSGIRLLAAAVVMAAGLSTAAGGEAASRPAGVREALGKAGANRGELEKALAGAKGDRREGMEFLIANMPERDLVSLKAEFLIENVEAAYGAFEKAPWRAKVPREIFLNEVLPYVNLNERRDNWRADFAGKFQGLVKDCRGPAEAAAKLNNSIFGVLKVRYSTDRPKADQSPYESTAAGKASCTGLSIILVDACRAVGVPARIAGAPLWSDMSGNHTWVEVWDEGWHFTGGGEPSGDKLDGAWFVGRASAAKAGHPLHALYAASFRKTGMHFPLAWEPEARYVPAVEVTERYVKKEEGKKPEPGEGRKGEAKGGVGVLETTPVGKRVAEALARYFRTEPGKRGEIKWEGELDEVVAREPGAVRGMAWRAYCGGWERKAWEEEWKGRRVAWETHVSPYTVKEVGTRPAGGWGLFIAMHGGGGAPAEVNDSQWAVMQRYYRDHPEAGGYLYVAVRAPNNDWNGFYATYNLELTDRLIRQMVMMGQVDANRVFLMGYSHGGYGAYFQGTRLADRFAAVHVSAGAPTEWQPLFRNWRNTACTVWVGDRDTMYGRLDRCKWVAKGVEELRKQSPGEYPVQVEVKSAEHSGLRDRDMITRMNGAVRKPVPRRVTWEQSAWGRMNWLSTARAGDGAVDAVVKDNHVELKVERCPEVTVWLDERLVDLGSPVRVAVNGRETVHTVRPSLRVLCEALAERGDPEMMFTARIVLTAPAAASQPATKAATRGK